MVLACIIVTAFCLHYLRLFLGEAVNPASNDKNSLYYISVVLAPAPRPSISELQISVSISVIRIGLLQDAREC